MTQTKNPSRIPQVGLIFLSPLVFGLLGLGLGKDASWDFLNYHWYNPYSFLNGRLGFDIGVAHHATYYNPVMDVPFFLIATSQPAWMAGFFLAGLHGINCNLLILLASSLIRIENNFQRHAMVTTIALAGMFGAGAFGQLGVPSYDTVVSIGILGMLLVVIRKSTSIFHGTLRESFLWASLAGLAAGASVGLKLTMAVYGLGFGIAFLFMSLSWKKRLTILCAFGFGGIVGFLLLAGPWMFQLWLYSGNPLFPYFNNFFDSPLLVSASYRDTRFIPTDLVKQMFFPFYFSANSFHVAEYHFRDVRILLAYILIPISLLVSLLSRKNKPGKANLTDSARFLFIGSAFSYFLWIKIFAIYRYLIVLEMLAPLLIALALVLLPFRQKQWAGATLFLLLASQALVSVGFNRHSWENRYVEVSIPPIPKPESAMVLMTGFAPMAYVIPSFPPEIPFLRIQGYLAGPEEKKAEIALAMRRKVSEHAGDIYVLFLPAEKWMTTEALSAYNLELLEEKCATITANIGEPLSFCGVIKR